MTKTKLNKKLIIGVIIAIVIIGIIITLIIVNLNKEKTISCSREDKISDFTINDDLKVYLKDDKIIKLDIVKSITVGDELNVYTQYDKSILNQMQHAYNYLDEDDYKIKQKDHKTTATVSIKEKGLVLNNINLTAKDPEDKLRISFNVVNNLETASSSIKIDDEYTEKELKKMIEGFEFKCE